MRACLAIQARVQVSFLGPEGTFGHIAARQLFGLAALDAEATTIDGVFDAVRRGAALYGVVPIGIGTGSFAFSAQWIPSGLAALFVTTQPFWLVASARFAVGAEPLQLRAVISLLWGLAGVGVLVAPGLARPSAQGRRPWPGE